ncbi:ribonuclease H-like domain-containing protein [Natrialbaceae archaeon AArc-T1-2]|uniref:ribonuclease H-like domain-containing protein n=1 Tax=Natrialbaceae archaeon AArc-T1-2 TaxID=3053904 RepID=UPI00255AD888|nr:ribonuclease H-like domain-containing protein [Natrialbaceae archaeon AArc-T1-2]WIV66568.1 ribonuclease H-like domain-containing protein [Natrialbaceae archaeon AArc-T1-2]
MAPRLALDIETVPLVSDPAFDDPSDWKPFCITVGYQPARGETVETEVLFRQGATFRYEQLMFDDFFDWVTARHDTSERVELVTYNGDSYDIPILKDRAYKVTGELDSDTIDRLYLLLQACDHVDLILDLKADLGYYCSLDDALAMHNIEADAPTWNGEKVTGKHMLDMGEKIMNGSAPDELIEAVRRYAASDVEPLFELHDKIEQKTTA